MNGAAFETGLISFSIECASKVMKGITNCLEIICGPVSYNGFQ